MPETLWDGGPTLRQAPGVFPMGTDSILLADFAHPGARDTAADLGAGSGIVSILLSYERPGVRVLAVEKSAAALELARENIAANGLSGRVTVLDGDLRDDLIPAGSVDLAVSNPPYFPVDGGYVAQNGLASARSDGDCTLSQLCTAAARMTRWGGRFCLVFRPERLCELIFALRSAGFEPKRLRPVHHAPGFPANLILLDARRGGKPGLAWEPDLFLYTPSGEESPAVRAIYRRT